MLPDGNVDRQDFSMQNTTTLPINDATAFPATVKVLTASNPAAGLWSLPSKDKLRVLRTLALAQVQTHQTIKPYQRLRYWSNVPFRHGPTEVVKYSATSSPDNRATGLQSRSCSSGYLHRCRKDDVLGQTSERQLLDRKRKPRVERSGSALSNGRAACPLVKITPSARCRRINIHRRHRKLDTRQQAAG